MCRKHKLTRKQALEIASRYGVEDLVNEAMRFSWYHLPMSPINALADNDIFIDEETLKVL